EDALEATDGFLQGHVLAGRTGEDLGHVEGLRQEALDLTSAGYQLLVFLGQLGHTEDGGDVLQLLVALQNVLNATGHFVVLLTDDQRIQRAAGGVQRVRSRARTPGAGGTAQCPGRVKGSGGGGRRRVSPAVRRYVSGLDGGDGTGLGGGDTLLQNTHLLGQSRLITYGRRHTTQQRGYFGTGQGVTVDVVD